MTPSPSPSDPRWVLYKHTSNFEIVRQTAIELHSTQEINLSSAHRRNLLRALRRQGLYRGRNSEDTLDSIQHRINTLVWYMFGYRKSISGEQRFIFSPLGNLFLKHRHDRDLLDKILLTMVWGKQFPDVFGTPNDFRIYPFRLLFKLMLDPRLDNRLSGLDYAHCVARLRTIDEVDYENLVKNILEFRTQDTAIQEIAFRSAEYHHVNAYHEWEYTSRLLQSFGLVNKSQGRKLFYLQHGSSTRRWIKGTQVSVCDGIKEFCGTLMDAHPYSQQPIDLNDPERLHIDALKEIYAFCPIELLRELDLDEKQPAFQLINLPKLINELALNPNPSAPNEFEVELTNAMNHFVDVDATHLGGSGQTDIECFYRPIGKKFAIDAKSTSRKLSSLNAGRIKGHQEKISAVYTIVITPSYTPSVLLDIRPSDKIVILLVNTFAEYLYNFLVAGRRDISFEPLHELAVKNLGGDMSEAVSQMTINLFSARANSGSLASVID